MSKIVALFENKAFDTGLLTTLAAAGAVFGFNVPVGLILGILTPIMVGIGAQGWSEAVKMKAKMALEHEVKMHALTNGHASYAEVLSGKTPEVRAKNAQAGFAKLGVMIAIVFMIPISAVVVTTNSGCKNPPPIVTDIIDCAKTEGITVGNGLSITQLVSAVVGILSGNAADAWTAIQPLLKQYGGDMVACVLDSLENPQPAPGAGSGSGSAAPPMSVSASEMMRRDLLSKVANNKKIVRAHR